MRMNISLSLKNRMTLHIMEKIILFLIGFSLFFFKNELLDSFTSGYLLLKIGLGLNIYLIIKSRKIKPVAILFLFALTYLLNLIALYRDNVDISGGYNIFDRLEYYNNTLWIHVLFLYSISLFFPLIKERFYLKDKLIPEFSRFYFWITFIFMAFIALFGYTGGSILESGGYGNMSLEAAGGTSIFEYFIVLVPLIYIFCGNNKLFKTLATALILYYIYKGLSFGFRNQVLQLSLLLFAMFDSPRLKYWQLILISIIPLYLLLIYGSIRLNPLIIFTDNISDILMEPINNFGFNLLGNQNDIFYASVRVYGFLEQGIIDAVDRIVIITSNMLAIIVPYSYLPEMANIAGYRQADYGSGGGTLISMYWFLFAGLPGVVFIGWYLSFIIKKFTTTSNKYFLLYFLLVLTTYPRWFGYNQISLFKISLYGVLYLLVLEFLSRIIKLVTKDTLNSGNLEKMNS